jgi:hypothetical protein
MAYRCEVTPISAFQSTNLSSKIDSFGRLSERILRSLGYPFINIELHRDQLNENISIACEMFAKYAGYTREYLVFNSNLYIKNYGLKVDALFTAKASDTFAQQIANKNLNPQYSKYLNNPTTTVYVNTSSIPGSYFTSMSGLSSSLMLGTTANMVLDSSVYTYIVNQNPSLREFFIQSQQQNFTIQGEYTDNKDVYLNSFDYDVMDYRKVVAIVDFEEGSTTGINTLFTIEQTLAQQTYFSYAMGNYGFDLVSWYVLKDWLKNREKLLATKPSWDFDDRTQIMRLYPQPQAAKDSNTQYYGVLQCYVERPLRDIIKEQWVYQYAYALCKITLARVRGKYTDTTLFGGGRVNANMLEEGLKEKEELEKKLYEGTPGLGDNEPPLFFVG